LRLGPKVSPQHISEVPARNSTALMPAKGPKKHCDNISPHG
jgi:hypothetical protein